MMCRDERLRRVLILGCHFAGNLAYYQAGWDGKKLIRQEQFWVRINGNCLDIAVLEWCKLFAETKGKHCWRNIVSDPSSFSSQLFAIFGGEQTYDFYCEKLKTYRDKFVAHLDSELTAHIPVMDEAWTTARIYYNHIVANEISPSVIPDAPCDLQKFYDERHQEAESAYRVGV